MEKAYKKKSIKKTCTEKAILALRVGLDNPTLINLEGK